MPMSSEKIHHPIVHSIRDIERTDLLEQRGMSDGVEGLAEVNGQDNDVWVGGYSCSVMESNRAIRAAVVDPAGLNAY